MEKLITWSEAYAIGVPNIDEQHQRLVQLSNLLSQASATGRVRHLVGPILQDLVDYTAQHFVYEEQLMREADYPGYPAHKAEHDRIVERVMGMKRAFEEGDAEVGAELMDFMQMWLVGHIRGADRDYAPCLRAGGMA